MHADARKLLWDAQDAAKRMARFTAGNAHGRRAGYAALIV
jgi:hypothetical protein